MQQLNPMDAQFVDAEDQDKHASFAIASIAVFEGPWCAAQPAQWARRRPKSQ